jgi:7,8-dihydropterin-6-yl-methyl-4-(beta-D-ribofuranosyl)aminobenzene 5'-phosphate synthase
MKASEFGHVRKARITILMDNRADLLAQNMRGVRYFNRQPLLAEHGFSALVRLKDPDMTILWDAGVTRHALLENMRRMKISPGLIEKIALSHGHSDHYMGLGEVLRAISPLDEPREWNPPVCADDVESWLMKRRIPLVLHPAALRERWAEKDDGTMQGPFEAPPALEWESLGARIIKSEGPYQLAPGCWTSGFIPRRSFEKSGRWDKLRYREGDVFLADDLEEDQAIVIHVKGKGLVVLSGCAHAGIVNTVQHAREISGIDRVWAILGGFHLARANTQEMRNTVAHIQALSPKLVMPMHCTGLAGIRLFAAEMPQAFVEGLVGITLSF